MSPGGRAGAAAPDRCGAAPEADAAVWVQKFGGTSLADPARIEAAAARAQRLRAAGKRLLLVVSAMGRTTDDLLRLAQALSAAPPRRELDALLSAGEQQSAALLAIALAARGVPAISLTGQQGGILTDHRHAEARIRTITGERIRAHLAAGRVVVIAGFQGVNEADDITTLGRGGSDTSAVALAAALGAERCQILTDVEGVFTADPRVVPEARRIVRLTYDEMLEMATHGARVLHGRAVDLARRFRVPLSVGAAGAPGPGTSVGAREEMAMEMESVVVRAVTHDGSVRKISLLGVPDRPGVAARVFELFGSARLPVRLIVQAESHRGHNDITCIVPDDVPLPEGLLAEAVAEVGGSSYLLEERVGLLSVIGEGIAREPGVAARVFAALAAEDINIDVISTSQLVITCVVAGDRLERGARALHRALLEEPQAPPR